MELPEFKLDAFYAKYAYQAKFNVSSSSAHALTVGELVNMESTIVDKIFKTELSYPPFEGIQELLSEISTLYKNIHPDEIKVTHGAEEAIFAFMNVVLCKGDHVIVQYPTYQSLYEIARSIDAEVTYWTANEHNGWCFDLNFVRKNIKDNTKAIVVALPNSPTGSTLQIQEWLDLISICKENGLILFSDEVYRFSEISSNTLPAACDLFKNAVTVGDMSKTFALPGLRIGWLATRNKAILEQCNKYTAYTSISVNPISQLLSTVALRNKQTIIQRTKAIAIENMQILFQFVEKNSSLFSLSMPKAGLTAFVKLLLDEDVEDFCIKLFQETGVLFLPGNRMEYDNKHFRVGIGVKHLKIALDIVQNYIDVSLSASVPNQNFEVK